MEGENAYQSRKVNSSYNGLIFNAYLPPHGVPASFLGKEED
jgi:hypothetical protein